MSKDFVRFLCWRDAGDLLNILVQTPVEGAIAVTLIPLMILNYADGEWEPGPYLQTSEEKVL